MKVPCDLPQGLPRQLGRKDVAHFFADFQLAAQPCTLLQRPDARGEAADASGKGGADDDASGWPGLPRAPGGRREQDADERAVVRLATAGEAARAARQLNGEFVNSNMVTVRLLL